MPVKRKNEKAEARKMQLSEWLRHGLDKPGKQGNALASILGIDPATVSKMLTGGRVIRETELADIARYIEEPIPPLPGTKTEQRVSVIHAATSLRWATPTVIIAPFQWRERSMTYQGTVEVPLSMDERLKGVEQYVCEVQAEGRFATCAPFRSVRQAPLNGDKVHVRRTNGSLIEDTLRTVSVQGGKTSLHLEGSGEHVLTYPPESDAYEIVGIVVGMYTAIKF